MPLPGVDATANVNVGSIYVMDRPAAKYIDNLPEEGMTVPQEKDMIYVIILGRFQVDARTNKAKEENEEEKYRKYYVIQPVSHHGHNYLKYFISTKRMGTRERPILESGKVDFDENSWETKEKIKPDNPPKESDRINWRKVPVLQCVNIIAFIRFYTKRRYEKGNNNFRKENKFFGTWVAAREHPVLQKHLDIKANTEVIKKGGLDVNTESGKDNMKKLIGNISTNICGIELNGLGKDKKLKDSVEAIVKEMEEKKFEELVFTHDKVVKFILGLYDHGNNGADPLPADDDSEDKQGEGNDFTSGDGGPNLDLSRDAAGTPGGGNNSVANMSGLAMDDDDSATQASTSSNKRPREEKKPRKRRRKRRKVVIDNNETELTTEHINDMISNTDDIVRTMIHPASIWDEEGLGRDYKTLVKERLARDGITFINLITTEGSSTNKKKNNKGGKNVVPSLTRPFLVDESEMNGGGSRLHPDLQKLWQDNYWKALDQPCPFKRRDGAAEDDDAMEEEPVDDVARVRRDDGKADDDSYLGSQQSDLNVEKEDQDPQQGGPPLDEDDFNFPTGGDDEEEEQEEDAPVPDFGDDEEQDLGVVLDSETPPPAGDKSNNNSCILS